MTLFKQYFRVQRTGLMIWTGFNALVGWTLAVSAKSMQATNALADFLSKVIGKLPDSVKALLGLVQGVSPVDNLIQGKMGFWMALALPIYGCLMAVAAITREIDKGTADFLFALPVRRRDVVLARWGVMALNLFVVALTSWAALAAGLSASAVQGNYAGYFWMLMQAAFLGLAVGSLALLMSVWVSDYDRAARWSMAGVGLLFVLDIAMEVAGLPRFARAFNPFSYFSTVDPVQSGRPMLPEAGMLLAMSVVALLLAVKAFQSRELEA